MTVFSSDGEKLGKVLSCDASTFTVEKGFFFPKDYVARYDDVAAVTGDDIRLASTKERFTQMRDTGLYSHGGSTSSIAARTDSDEVRVPVAEEELDVVKRSRNAGEVIRKERVDMEGEHVRGMESDFSRRSAIRRDPDDRYAGGKPGCDDDLP